MALARVMPGAGAALLALRCALLACMVGGCQGKGPAAAAVTSAPPVAVAPAPPVAVTSAPPVALAPAPPAAAVRTGDWLGGPEPLSGKLPTGIVSWWRLQPRQPRAGEAFELTLRLEGVKQDGARVSLRAGDGARLQGEAVQPAWSLKAGEAAELKVQVVAPAGNSFIHVETRQGERSSVRSILLALPGTNPAGAGQQRQDYATDARGEPIVRMQSEGKKP